LSYFTGALDDVNSIVVAHCRCWPISVAILLLTRDHIIWLWRPVDAQWMCLLKPLGEAVNGPHLVAVPAIEVVSKGLPGAKAGAAKIENG
jgi:hypothetical protein